jgi:hypothetical protein
VLASPVSASAFLGLTQKIIDRAEPGFSIISEPGFSIVNRRLP